MQITDRSETKELVISDNTLKRLAPVEHPFGGGRTAVTKPLQPLNPVQKSIAVGMKFGRESVKDLGPISANFYQGL